MREILFRGKRLDNGEWVEGFITAACDCTGRSYFIQQPARDPDDCNHSFAVDFSTVGQYTGLTDKNGTKVFEGDILECLGKVSEVADDFTDTLDPFFCKHSEVVGNVHDSTELTVEVLKRRKNNEI